MVGYVLTGKSNRSAGRAPSGIRDLSESSRCILVARKNDERLIFALF